MASPLITVGCFAAAAGIVVGIAFFSANDVPICLDRDLPMTERVFTACVTATAKSSVHAPYTCRQEAERLSCRTESRR